MRQKRIIGVNSNCYHGYSLEEALEGICRAGFHYVELTATAGWTEHVFPTQLFDRLCRVRNRLEEERLTPFALSGHCNLMDAQRLPDFIRNIELAAFFGCRYIVSSIGEAHLQDRERVGKDVLVKHLESLLPWLERFHLRLVLETHGEHCTGAILKEITDRVQSERIRINYDTANVVFYGGVNPVTDMDACIDEIAYMHLKDKAGEQNEWNFPALGKGTIDFPEIFRKLERAGNDCPLSLEIEFTQAGPENLAEVNDAVSDSAEYLRQCGFVL